MRENEPIEILTPDQAAELLGITKRVVLRMAKNKELPAFKLGGLLWRFNKSHLVKWMADHRIKEP